MIEIGVSITIAAVSGLGVLFGRVNARVSDLDKRIDGFELRVAERYVTKSDFQSTLERVEAHMVRIENKLDRLIS